MLDTRSVKGIRLIPIKDVRVNVRDQLNQADPNLPGATAPPGGLEHTAYGRLTPRQHAVLDAIVASYQNTGMPPTLAEIGNAIGVKRHTAAEHVSALQHIGIVRRTRARQRKYVLTPAGMYRSGLTQEKITLAGAAYRSRMIEQLVDDRQMEFPML